jgi:hypothetical protein
VSYPKISSGVRVGKSGIASTEFHQVFGNLAGRPLTPLSGKLFPKRLRHCRREALSPVRSEFFSELVGVVALDVELHIASLVDVN